MLLRLYRWLVFLIGDLHFWHEKRIDHDEIDEVIQMLHPGDIILHRDSWCLSNLFIGGTFIHAGIVSNDLKIIEAISEGVVKRNARYILHSDYVCVLRPRMGQWTACEWAERIVGYPYDEQFDFNTEEERKFIKENQTSKKNKFCCTEIPYFCYMDIAHDLGFFRKRDFGILKRFLVLIGLSPGRTAITADNYVEAYGCEVIWNSKMDGIELSEIMQWKLK